MDHLHCLDTDNDFIIYNRWKKSHLYIILGQDLIDLENVQQIIQIETLIYFYGSLRIVGNCEARRYISTSNTMTWFRLYRTTFRKSRDYFGMYAKIDGMKRYLENFIREDLDKNIVLLTGPRQAGNTTLSKMLTSDYDYFNFDNLDDRLSLQEKYWDRTKGLVVFAETRVLVLKFSENFSTGKNGPGCKRIVKRKNFS